PNRCAAVTVTHPAQPPALLPHPPRPPTRRSSDLTVPIGRPEGNTPPSPEETTNSSSSRFLSDSSIILNKSELLSSSYSSIKPKISFPSSREIVADIILN